MTHERPDDQPRDPPDDVQPGVAPEDDLDTLLAEASSLAGELSEEVGEVESTAVSSQAVQPTGTPTGSSGDLDAHLAELEELARTAGSEIGAGPDDPAAKPVPPTSPAPGVMTEETIDNVPGLGDRAGPDHATADVPDASEQPETEPEGSQPDAEEECSARANSIHCLATLLSPPALAVCERGVTLLETINKPLGRIGRMPRRIIGLAAIATFATSLIVLLFSLF